MVVCVLCAAGLNGRGVFYVRLGSLVCVFIFGRVFCGCLGAVALACFGCVRAAGLLLRVAYSVCGQALLLGAWPGPLSGCILRTVEVCCVGRAAGLLLLWRILWMSGRPPYLCVWSGRGVFCGCQGVCCMGVFSVRSGPMAVACPGCGWGESYSSCGWAPIAGCVFCGWPSPVARCAARPSCGVYFAYGRGLLCGACAVRRWVPVVLAYSC